MPPGSGKGDAQGFLVCGSSCTRPLQCSQTRQMDEQLLRQNLRTRLKCHHVTKTYEIFTNCQSLWIQTSKVKSARLRAQCHTDTPSPDFTQMLLSTLEWNLSFTTIPLGSNTSVWFPLSGFHSTEAHPQRPWRTTSSPFLRLVIRGETGWVQAAIYCLRWVR